MTSNGKMLFTEDYETKEKQNELGLVYDFIRRTQID
jgi:hypothetical protein